MICVEEMLDVGHYYELSGLLSLSINALTIPSDPPGGFGRQWAWHVSHLCTRVHACRRQWYRADALDGLQQTVLVSTDKPAVKS